MFMLRQIECSSKECAWKGEGRSMHIYNADKRKRITYRRTGAFLKMPPFSMLSIT